MFKRSSLLFVLLLMCMISTAASAATFKLPDTGQTKCYQNKEPWAEIPCTGTRQDGAYNINPVSYTDNGDGTVTDNNTGFMWPKEHSWTYNWFEASGTYDATYNPTSRDICGSLHLGSHSDWWLPTEKELLIIVDYTVPWPGPTIDTTYFPNTEAFYFWSSTIASYLSTPLTVDFSYGKTGSGYMSDYFYVRCVRGGHYPDNNYVENGDGTVTDNATGLIWQQGEGGQRTWGSALSYCEGLSLGGHSDWRLPNINEIESLTDYSKNPPIDTTYFPNAYASCYWSSTTIANFQNYAWSACGGVGGTYKGNDDYARCVRGGCNTPVNPGLTSPPNDATGVSTAPTLDWDDVSGATSYEVQVCTDESCLSVVRTATPTNSDWTVTPSLKPVKTYYWHVRAVSDCAQVRGAILAVSPLPVQLLMCPA